jgi:hypothetical protein
MKRISDGLLEDSFRFLSAFSGNRAKLRSLSRGLPMQLRQNGLYCLLIILDGDNGAGPDVAREVRRFLKLTGSALPNRHHHDYLFHTARTESLLVALKRAVEAWPDDPQNESGTDAP